MEYVKVNNIEYPASISGMMQDSSWDNRESKTIKFENNVMPFSTAEETFVEGTAWSIISEWVETVIDPETGEESQVTKRQEFDNSDFSVAGQVTDMRDGGTVLVKMGKLTEIESLINSFYKDIN